MRLIVGLCAVTLSVSACGGSKAAVKPASTSPSASASIPGMTHPSAVQQAAFLRDLAAVSPRLVRDRDRAVRHGQDICLTLAESHKVAVKNAAEREGVDSGVAEQMVAVAQRNFCPR